MNATAFLVYFAIRTTQADVEAAFQRITNHKGVKGILIVDDEGRELRTTLSAELTEKYSELIPQLASMARSAVRDLDPSVRFRPRCCTGFYAVCCCAL